MAAAAGLRDHLPDPGGVASSVLRQRQGVGAAHCETKEPRAIVVSDMGKAQLQGFTGCISGVFK